MAAKASNPFTDLGNTISGWFSKIWQSIVSEFNKALVVLETILDVKAKVKEDFTQLIEFAREATQEQTDFVERVKTLEKRLIRADVAFKIVDDIRTGELKRFVTEIFTDMDSTLQEMLQTFHDTTAQFRSLTGITHISGILIKILSVWLEIEKFVTLLNEIKPVLEELNAKLKEYEDIILPQNNPRVRVDDPGYHYSRRG